MQGSASTVVVGIGNPLMRDEGVGVRLTEFLEAEYQDCADIEVFEAGSVGLGLLHIICGRRKAIIIDCARMGEAPGTIRRFRPEDVRSVKPLSRESLHEADLLQVVELSRQLGECPEHVVFFGIEPEVIAPGEGLSEALLRELPEYVMKIRREIDGCVDHA